MNTLLYLVCIFISFKSFSEVVEHPTEIIVSVKKSQWENLLGQTSFKSMQVNMVVEKLSENEQAEILYIKLNPVMKSEALLQELNRSSLVNWAESNMIFVGDPRENTGEEIDQMFDQLIPNDPLYSKQDHLKIIGAHNVWEQLSAGEEIIVAVTDDGFDLEHEDLTSSYYINKNEIPRNSLDDDNNGYVDDYLGWNFDDASNDPSSDNSYGAHGTHVAGILAAAFNNKKGVTGISPKIRVMPLKFYGNNAWTAVKVFQTYKYAVDNGAKIISTSYQIDDMSKHKVYNEALDYAYSKGVIVFNSAGNSNVKDAPRNQLSKIVLVSSGKSTNDVATQDIKSDFSNYGHGVDVMAPGDPVYSTIPGNNYYIMRGTSMAAPGAAGVAAAIWSLNPTWNKEQIVAAMMASVDLVEAKNPNYKFQLGNGRVNIEKAVQNKFSAPSIAQTWFDPKTKELKILVRGVFQPQGLTQAFVIEQAKTLESMPLQLVEDYHFGTNIIRIKFEARSGQQYQLRILADKAADPFGRSLDGDRDGVPGGDYTAEFKVL